MNLWQRNSLFPQVIKNLLIANVVVFILQYFLGSFSISGTSLYDIIFIYGALFPVDSGNFYPWQILSYQFLHGGFGHIFFNMIMLWMFGSELANIWGTRKFLIFYLLSGIGAAIVQLFISPLLGTTGPTVGASGSIYGIFLAFALSFPDRRILVFPLFIPIKAKYLIIILVFMDFIMGFSTGSRIAHFAHLGGAATGWFLLKYAEQIGVYKFFDNLIPPKTKNNNWNNFNQQNPNFWNSSSKPHTKTDNDPKVFKVDWFKKPGTNQSKDETTNKYKSKFHVNGEEIDQSKIDEILDKISESGYNSLTDREKEILFELSKKIK